MKGRCEGKAKEKEMFLRSDLFIVYAPVDVIIFLSADIPRNRLGASLLVSLRFSFNC